MIINGFPPAFPPAGGGGGYSNAVLADSPVGYWMMGEDSGTVASDSGGNGYNGQYEGGYTLGQAGILPTDAGSSVAINATSGKVAISASLPDLTGNWTIEAWINVPSAGAGGNPIWGRWTSAGSQRQLLFYVHPNGKLQIDIPYIAAILNGSAVVADGLNHYVAATRIGNTWSLYVDGLLDASTSNSATQEGGSVATIGHSESDVHSLNGRMAQVAAYDYALTLGQLAAHFDAA